MNAAMKFLGVCCLSVGMLAHGAFAEALAAPASPGSLREGYDKKLDEIKNLKVAIADLENSAKVQGYKATATLVIAGVVVVLAYRYGGKLIDSGTGRGEVGMGPAFGGCAVWGVGLVSAVGGGIYWYLNRKGVTDLKIKIAAKEQELNLKKDMADFYLREHPELNGASQK